MTDIRLEPNWPVMEKFLEQQLIDMTDVEQRKVFRELLDNYTKVAIYNSHQK